MTNYKFGQSRFWSEIKIPLGRFISHTYPDFAASTRR